MNDLIPNWGDLSEGAKLDALHNALNAHAQQTADTFKAQQEQATAIEQSVTALEGAAETAKQPKEPAKKAEAPASKGGKVDKTKAPQS